MEAWDGLRGIAVAAVVVHHARPEWLPGGWLGVDVFFVLSGFLVTSLLVDHPRPWRSFWARRVRRLAPALVLVLVAIACWSAVARDRLELRGLRGDGLAALASVVNWRFVAAGESYFDRFADPSLLRHLWSLSVEGQFYLLWPVLLAGLLHAGRRRAAVVTALLACASAVAMVVMVPGDAMRAYFGTDTHAHGLLIGSALALARWRIPAAAGTVALVGLMGAFAMVERIEATPAVGLVTAATLAAASPPPVLGWRPFVALGRISYAVYLWHWPLLLLLDEASLAVPLALTLAAASASWWLVERPALAGRGRLLLVPGVALNVLALAVLVPPVRAPEAAAEAAAEARAATRAPAAPATTPIVEGRVLVVGDSVAHTLFPGLRAHEGGAGLEFFTATATGCPLDVDASRFVDDVGPIDLVVPEECDWRASWAPIVERLRPALVVALWGLWDTTDHVVGDRLLRWGTPEWHAHLTVLLHEAADVLTARGARLVVLTTPYVHSGDPGRVDAFNGVVAAVASTRADVAVVDLWPAVDRPDARRWDGVHFTEDGARAVGGRIVPELAAEAGR